MNIVIIMLTCTVLEQQTFRCWAMSAAQLAILVLTLTPGNTKTLRYIAVTAC